MLTESVLEEVLGVGHMRGGMKEDWVKGFKAKTTIG